MKQLLSFAILSVCLSCSKSSYETITGTVINQGGASAASWVVSIDESSSKRYSFLCHDQPGTTDPASNCHNSIFVTNLPAALKTAGLKIKFSRYSDKGRNLIWSSTYAPHDVEVYDATKNE